jgi:hypothetical protein
VSTHVPKAGYRGDYSFTFWMEPVDFSVMYSVLSLLAGTFAPSKEKLSAD